MVSPEAFEFTHYEQIRLLGYTQFLWDQTQEIAFNVFTNPGGEPTVSYLSSGGGGGPMPLRFILSGNSVPSINLPQVPPVLSDRVKRWLTSEVVARLSNPATK